MHWSFDIRTAILLGAALTFLIGVMLQVVSYSQPVTYRSMMRWWVFGAVTFALGFALTGLREWIWIGWSAVLANTLIAVGMSCFAIALRRFFGVPERRKRLFALAAACLAVSVWFVAVQPQEELRHGLTSVIFALYCAACLRAVYRSGQRPTISHHIAGFYFTLGLTLLTGRALAIALLHSQVHDIFQTTPLSVAIYGVGGLIPVVSTVGFLLMCTERSQRELEQSARMDFLTGIFNRGAIEELAVSLLASAQRHGIPLALMVVDIDHFKRINDELGHAAGDKALAATVHMMQGFLRSDDLMGRLGGEEFVVLMPDTDVIQARHAAERMRMAVGSSRVDLQACKLEYSIVSPK